MEKLLRAYLGRKMIVNLIAIISNLGMSTRPNRNIYCEMLKFI